MTAVVRVAAGSLRARWRGWLLLAVLVAVGGGADRRGLGVPSGTLVPVSFVLLMVPAAILLANAVAYWPARAAAGLSPARVLRAE